MYEDLLAFTSTWKRGHVDRSRSSRPVDFADDREVVPRSDALSTFAFTRKAYLVAPCRNLQKNFLRAINPLIGFACTSSPAVADAAGASHASQSAVNYGPFA